MTTTSERPRVITQQLWDVLPETRRRGDADEPDAGGPLEMMDDAGRWVTVLIIGEMFPCPSCGVTNQWTAHYMVPSSQGIELVVAENGGPEEVDYDGDTDSFDAEENEYYQCGYCSAYMNLDGTPRSPDTLSDSEAVRQLHTMLSGRRWDGAADFLQAIAGVIASTGRKIDEAHDDSPRWNDAVPS